MMSVPSIFFSVLQDIIVGIMAGLFSGWLVGIYFKKKDQKREYSIKKEEVVKEWLFYLSDLNEEIAFEYSEQPVEAIRVKRLLNKRLELILKAVPYADKESLLALQDELAHIEEEIDSEIVDVKKIDERLKKSMKEVGAAFTNHKQKACFGKAK